MKRYLLTLITVLTVLGLKAQDPHFSQFNASPLTLNPALAGKVSCTYRASVNYRNQWNSIPAPYETYTAGFDAALLKDGALNGSAIGVGLLLANDVSGDGNLAAPNVNLFLGYHQLIGESSYLSVGFQGSFNEKRVDPTKLIFPNQIGPNGVNPSLPNGEPLTPEIQFFDINAGMHFSSIVSDKFSFNLGGAYYHITEPTESFLNSSNNEARLYSRYVGHGGFSVALNDQWSLSPSVLYMQQAAVDQLNAGTSLGYHLEDASIYFGTWYRLHLLNMEGTDEPPISSVVALVGLEFSTLKLGFSYDVSVNSVTAANNGRGGFELSLQYTGCITKSMSITHCPSF